MSNKLAKRESVLPELPSREVARARLEALGDADLFTFVERATEWTELGLEVAEDRLRRWVEGEGKTYREVASITGKSKSRIGQLCLKFGITSTDNRGGRRVLSSAGQNEDPWNAEQERQSRPRKTVADGPDHYMPDVAAPDADQNLRTQALHWFEQGLRIKELLDKRRTLEPRSADDRTAIKKRAALMESTARRLKESLK